MLLKHNIVNKNMCRYICNIYYFSFFSFVIVPYSFCSNGVSSVIRLDRYPSEYDDKLLRVDPANSRDDSAPLVIGTIILAPYNASISSNCWLKVSSRRCIDGKRNKYMSFKMNRYINHLRANYAKSIDWV